MYYWSKFCKKIRLKAIYESEIDKRAHIAAGCHIYKSKIGKYTAVGYDCQIIHCKIGNFCSLAGNIVVGARTILPNGYLHLRFLLSKKIVLVKNFHHMNIIRTNPHLLAMMCG